MVRVFVLGHEGFIGKNIMQNLRSSGIAASGFSFPPFDLSDERQAMDLKQEVQEDTVIVFASFITRDKGDDFLSFEKNLRMTANLLAVLKSVPCRKLVYLSSVSVYGVATSNPVAESYPANPESYYGLAKYASERMIWMSGVPSLILRLSNVYGPGDSHETYGPARFVKSALADNEIVLYGRGEDKRDFLHVSDAARLIVRLSLSDAKGICNVSSGRSVSFAQIAEVIARLKGGVGISFRERAMQAFVNEFDISRLREILPGESFIRVEDALSDMIRQEGG